MKPITQISTTERVVICRRCGGYGKVDAYSENPERWYPNASILCPECKGDGRMIEVTKTERIYKRIEGLELFRPIKD